MWSISTLSSLLLLQVAAVLANVSRETRDAVDLDPGNWPSCRGKADAPPTRVRTSDYVSYLRTYFATERINAYLVPSEDAHSSEYVSAYDKRRGFITGFQGSAGYAVITIDKQALWTDGRYFLEAEDTLDCNWILMRKREPGVPTVSEWLRQELRRGQRLGASPFLIGNSVWKYYSDELAKSGIYLTPVADELIDRFWRPAIGRPTHPDTPINALPMQYAGRSLTEKVLDMRAAMRFQGVDMLVSSALDDNAWLFNIRASDIPFNPFTISYAIIELNRTTLYILNHTRKLNEVPDDSATTIKLKDHLNTNSDGTCSDTRGLCVEVKEYDQLAVLEDIRNRSAQASKVWISYDCNQAIYSSVPENKIYQANTPMAMTKSVKNPVEVEGMKKAHIKDAVAVISFMAKLEKEIKEGKTWTELRAAREVERYRREQEGNRGLSFETISSTGPHGAIIHYAVNNLTDRVIQRDDVYLLDSGGQYLDGTTDVTRTFHFSTPTQYEKECYTRVLMGHIDLFQVEFPLGLYGRELDVLARAPLWDVGLVYRHGTGHGIGAYLGVHEAPVYISKSYMASNYLGSLILENQFLSDEPGFYEDGKFGIRLENIMMVVNATTEYHFPGTHFLTFEHVTLVPYEPNLIDVDLLSEKQIGYLNDYNQLVRERIGPLLEGEAYDWMIEKTEAIKAHSSMPIKQPNRGSFNMASSVFYLIVITTTSMLKFIL